MSGRDLNLGVLAPRECALYSSLFSTVPGIVGPSEMGVVKAGWQRAKYGEDRDGCIRVRPHGKQQAPSGMSAAGPVSVGQFRRRLHPALDHQKERVQFQEAMVREPNIHEWSGKVHPDFWNLIRILYISQKGKLWSKETK